ncbi:MAG TPA: aldo/keto reductase [Rhizomicrobium sp.]|jgi:aryl-alcohol dehydrogenase-like predicted oxidoreductase|nr:aldo/keto reductase [Rhizomicrobium sp.]
MNPNAMASGQLKIGGTLTVNRLGFGAMRITGSGIWGPPKDKAAALRTLKRLPELGVNFIDTADSYGPDVSEKLLREALYPYDGLVIATKAGFTRSGPDAWHNKGDPDYLIAQAQRSREKLGVEKIALWQLHRIDPRVPRDEQFGAVKTLLDTGVIAYAGLSEVSVAEIKAAQKIFPVATVQNHFNLADRSGEDVLDYCEAQGIGFIPWYPLAAGDLAASGGKLAKLAKAKNATPSQIALAWLLKRSEVMLPIPGTGNVAHLEENVAAAQIQLTDEEFANLGKAGMGAKPWRKGQSKIG